MNKLTASLYSYYESNSVRFKIIRQLSTIPYIQFCKLEEWRKYDYDRNNTTRNKKPLGYQKV